MASKWAEGARRVIARVVTDCRELGLDAARTIEAIDASYPFGVRLHSPYKVWLAERRKAIAALCAGSPDPLSRPCAACGAGARRPCRGLDVLPLPAELPVHAARVQLGHGPLFADAEPGVPR